ncbi:translation initiation factor eIF-2B subunit epsilon-like [Homarus americanus]|uniref:Translation initiation factor eIF-2B subunit epsilon-like n=1 Tax=Homarus americanus TaxID=6706 RepID=A0A8J5N9Y9_HOMAM|nr:translation initiation factor eIF-2B subunit epsilon-like [Homarus americanus]KAG7176675.1 Translation initiation factor eIF-2B subunit epsilon-like [Homarus americanus]
MAPQAELREEKTLQAVVLTDIYQEHDQPITQDLPKVLVPLVNTPLLDYTLDWLERSGVDEAIVYCRTHPHSDMIRQHCRGFAMRRGDCGLKISVVTSEDCHSMGDAMRDLYAKSLLKDDFFLVHGDVVATLDLKALMTKHKEYRAADKSVIMTSVYVNNEEEYIGDKEATATLITNSTTGKLLCHKRPSNNLTKFNISTELFQNSNELQVMPVVHDPNIAVCSEAVPSLFSDNFDYANRDNLIRGVIEQEELLGYTIRCEILDAGYATRASSFRLYEKVSGEVIRRMAYPMVSEVSLTSHRIRYTYDTFTNNYWEPSAKFHKGCGGTNVVVGAGSEVSMTAQLQWSVVGDHCIVEDNVKAQSAFIMNNVHIKAGCVLKHCFLGNNVTLEENVKLSPGCMVGAGVILGPNITVPPATYFIATPPKDEFNLETISQEPDLRICGTKGHAFEVVREVGDLAEQGSDGDYVEDLEEEEEDSEEDMSDSAPMSDEDEHREHEFKREMMESLANALRESSAAENVVLEINASRHAYNMSMEDVLTTVTQGIIRVGGEDKNSGDGSSENLWRGIKLSITAFTDVLRNYIRKDRDQVLVLNAIELLFSESAEYLPVAQKILYELNQTHEILDDEVVVHWFKRGGASTSAFPALKQAITRFIEWLEQEDSDDDDSDT